IAEAPHHARTAAVQIDELAISTGADLDLQHAVIVVTNLHWQLWLRSRNETAPLARPKGRQVDQLPAIGGECSGERRGGSIGVKIGAQYHALQIHLIEAAQYLESSRHREWRKVVHYVAVERSLANARIAQEQFGELHRNAVFEFGCRWQRRGCERKQQWRKL